jgi:hypothetical protein
MGERRENRVLIERVLIERVNEERGREREDILGLSVAENFAVQRVASYNVIEFFFFLYDLFIYLFIHIYNYVPSIC